MPIIKNLAGFTIDVDQFIRKTLFTARHSSCCYPENKFGLIPTLYKTFTICAFLLATILVRIVCLGKNCFADKYCKYHQNFFYESRSMPAPVF